MLCPIPCCNSLAALLCRFFQIVGCTSLWLKYDRSIHPISREEWLVWIEKMQTFMWCSYGNSSFWWVCVFGLPLQGRPFCWCHLYLASGTIWQQEGCLFTQHLPPPPLSSFIYHQQHLSFEHQPTLLTGVNGVCPSVDSFPPCRTQDQAGKSCKWGVGNSLELVIEMWVIWACLLGNRSHETQGPPFFE